MPNPYSCIHPFKHVNAEIRGETDKYPLSKTACMSLVYNFYNATFQHVIIIDITVNNYNVSTLYNRFRLVFIPPARFMVIQFTPDDQN